MFHGNNARYPNPTYHFSQSWCYALEIPRNFRLIDAFRVSFKYLYIRDSRYTHEHQRFSPRVFPSSPISRSEYFLSFFFFLFFITNQSATKRSISWMDLFRILCRLLDNDYVNNQHLFVNYLSVLIKSFARRKWRSAHLFLAVDRRQSR